MTTHERLQKRIIWLENMKTWLDSTDRQGVDILDELIKETRDRQSDLEKAMDGQA